MYMYATSILCLYGKRAVLKYEFKIKPSDLFKK